MPHIHSLQRRIRDVFHQEPEEDGCTACVGTEVLGIYEYPSFLAPPLQVWPRRCRAWLVSLRNLHITGPDVQR